jgi:two-component system LytT family response regulator/two-component system response regulator LytT
MTDRATSTITAVLVDDERLALDELVYLIKEFPDLEVVGTAANGVEALDLIEELDPDLVFLDVQMPGLDGLGVIRKLRETRDRLPYFILATAYDQYAVEAFRVEAMDYLLKPIEKDRLALSLDRARRAIEEKNRTTAGEAALELPAPATRTGQIRSKLLVRTANRNFVVDAQDVVYATIEDGLITIVTTAVEGQSNYRTIEELQSNLDPDTFWRVHRSYLVNLHRIKEIIPWFKSTYQLRMDDKKQTEIPVSRVQTKRLRELLKL